MKVESKFPRLLMVVAVFGTFGLVTAAYPARSDAARIRCSASVRWQPNVHPRCEQYRYARETIMMSHAAFIARKQDFSINGCNANLPQAGGCRKPYPYNQFDWTTDGCSGPTGLLPPAGAWTAIFREACELHDFGYRNFGKGLTLQSTERRRYYVDRYFRREMRRICSTWPRWHRLACVRAARTMYTAVRVYPGNYWGFS